MPVFAYSGRRSPVQLVCSRSHPPALPWHASQLTPSLRNARACGSLDRVCSARRVPGSCGTRGTGRLRSARVPGAYRAMMCFAVTFTARCGWSVSRLYAAECGSAAAQQLPELCQVVASSLPASASAAGPPWHAAARHPDMPTGPLEQAGRWRAAAAAREGHLRCSRGAPGTPAATRAPSAASVTETVRAGSVIVSRVGGYRVGKRRGGAHRRRVHHVRCFRPAVQVAAAGKTAPHLPHCRTHSHNQKSRVRNQFVDRRARVG